MIIVSNTSPIISLATVRELNLLQQLYDRIVIPQAVYRELTRGGITEAGAREVQTWEWFQTYLVVNQTLVAALREKVDLGEAEAIALAIELNADLLLIDERRGRKIASNMGLKCVGVLGILLIAKRRGLITAVRPVMDDLIAISGFRVGARLYADILESAGE